MPCWYCGINMRGKGSLRRKTRDHVTPKSKGGVSTVDACWLCNQRKGNLDLEGYRKLMGGIEFEGERIRRVNAERI